VAELRRSFGFPLVVEGGSDVGRVRSNNEDSWGVRWLDDGSLFVIVADGMGGHEAGEVASGLAVQVVEDVVSRDPEEPPGERLHAALLEANAVIVDEGTRAGTRGMGTTSITAILRGAQVTIAQVGDSRCYLVRDGHVIWRTMDHTRVQMLVDNGEISEEDAKSHPEAGMLTRALGHVRMADGRPLEPEVLDPALTLQDRTDALVFCSDGLTDLVDDWEIGQTIAGRTPEEAIAELIALACERGGHDNITVIIVATAPRIAAFDPSSAPVAWDADDEPEPDTFDVTADMPAPPPPAPIAYAPVPMDTPGEPASNKTMLYIGAAVVAVFVLGVLAFGCAAGAWVAFA